MAGKAPEVKEKRRDLVAGSLLLIFGLAWTVTVYNTVPVGRLESIGPRAFPLFLGILLTALAALMVTSVLRGAVAPPDDTLDDEMPAELAPMPFAQHMRIVATVCAIIAAYGYLMVTAGFVLATVLVVSSTLWLAIGIRRPLLIAGMSIGLAGGCWLVFGKLLGAYMPRGTLLPNLNVSAIAGIAPSHSASSTTPSPTSRAPHKSPPASLMRSSPTALPTHATSPAPRSSPTSPTTLPWPIT